MTINTKYIKEYRTRTQQSFDPEKIMIKQNGKMVNVYDMIQEARTDTEIYPTLYRYGCLDKMQINAQDVYQEFDQLFTLRDIYEQKQKADELWASLPLEVRKEFNGNPQEFMQNGEKWLKNKIAEQTKAEMTKSDTTETETKGN